MLETLLADLQATPAAQWLRGARWGYAAVSGGHVLGIALLVGAILPLDLRLLGFWRRVDQKALAGVLATDPAVVVADEPTTLLDLANSRRVGDLLLGLPQQLVLLTHDLDLAARCERVLVVADGRVVADADGPAGVAAYVDAVDRAAEPHEGSA